MQHACRRVLLPPLRPVSSPSSRAGTRAPLSKSVSLCCVSINFPRWSSQLPVRTKHSRMATTDAKDAKKQIRSEFKRKLANLSEQEVLSQSRNAQNVILRMLEYQQAKRIGIYLSMPKSEAQTDGLVGDALSHMKEVFVPYIYSVGVGKPTQKVMDMLKLDGFEEYSKLERDSWGIPSLGKERLDERENAMGVTGLSFKPDGEARELNEESVDGLDLIVVPGVAFDLEMNRMGHGAGFYDKFLTRFTDGGKRRKPYLVGLCLAEQILPTGKLVMQDWDWKVDAIACGDGTLLTPESQ